MITLVCGKIRICLLYTSGLYEKGERPDAIIDWPVDALDYEVVDIFNWQEEAAGMISQMEFVRRVNVQTETIERYVSCLLYTSFCH